MRRAAMNAEKRRIGFTLLELIVVVMIVGFLAAISIPNFRKARMQAPRRSLGFAVGGAMDALSFRVNINNGYLPLASAITTEGVYNEYYFDTGMKEGEVADQLFYPTYTSAVSRNPATGELENYISVGLNSNLDEAEFKRRKLNLVVVLDISGSMASQFDKYHYGGQQPAANVSSNGQSNGNMLDIAAANIANMLEHLNEEDSFALVLFDDGVETPFSLQKINEDYKNKLRQYVRTLKPRGGTNMELGMQTGISQYSKYAAASDASYENRIIFLTDAMPNTGNTSSRDLMSLAVVAAQSRIHSTFIGIGLAFNSNLIDRIAKVRGANYFSVQSAEEFKERMDDNFQYMVCPLVYNLSLKLVSNGYQIEKVYGSPDVNIANGELMKVSSLFPSPTNEDNETKGGLILLRLKKTGHTGDLKLVVDYEMHDGFACNSEAKVAFEGAEAEYYESSGIRKGILLARYVEIMKNWISSERFAGGEMYSRYREIWENEAVRLVASDKSRTLLSNFKKYLEQEIEQIKDPSLNREITLIDKILTSSGYLAQYKEEYDRVGGLDSM
ncbi:MAG: hypothetical protein CVV41_14000 [Candidatus Riflebacteria bacterium HGW-Riflebacteria-1]|jgi:Ca-activated chloride channel family protein|nr:MAG: hypothetical protein CVV41_14000 [Candidatus Riflebacteria bacterium HGW-Riflebacteria-1]